MTSQTSGRHLHAVSGAQVTAIRSGSNGGDIRERLARIEAQMEHVATREDIQKVKVWFLVGVIAAFGVAIPAAVGVAFAAVKLLVP